MVTTSKTSFDIAYEEALELAKTELLKRDVASACTQAGGTVTELQGDSRKLQLVFLNRTVTIDLPGCSFVFDSGEPVHIWEQIILLHYLLGDNSDALANTTINYRQVKDGATYYATFEKRSIKPLVAAFGNDPERLYAAARLLGAKKTDQGDAGVMINALPLVPLHIILWAGDEEFHADGTILFDETIEARLSAEDIAVLCQQVVFRIIKNRNTA